MNRDSNKHTYIFQIPTIKKECQNEISKQKIINKTSQDFLNVQGNFENEDTLRGIIERDYSDKYGVNIDEELSHLIVIQTAYAASARAITAADEMMQMSNRLRG